MREEFFAAVRRAKVPVDQSTLHALLDLVEKAMAEAVFGRDARIAERLAAAEGTMAGVEAAILARVGVEKLAEIQADGFEDEGDDAVLSLLVSARQELTLEAMAYRQLSGERDAEAPTGRSRKLQPEQERLLRQIAAAWTRFVDPELALPRRDINPDSPLLRYLDAVLGFIWKDDRPSKKVVLTYLADHVRPDLRSR